MKIIEYIFQHRNDFKAIYECEHCGNQIEAWGYDDDNFHYRVIPNIHCEKCNLKSDGTEQNPLDRKFELHK